MTDLPYHDAYARRMPGEPAVVPPSDPMWPPIFGEQASTDRLTRAWVRGYLDLLRRWRVDARLGALPTTFMPATSITT